MATVTTAPSSTTSGPPVLVTIPPAAAPVPQIKPGYQTLEGVVSFVVAVCGVIPATLGTNAPQLVQVVGLIASAISAISLAWQRTKLKVAHVNANAAGSVTTTPPQGA